MQCPALPPPETDAERRTRQLGTLHHLADLSVSVADVAAGQICGTDLTQPPSKTPSADLARATKSVLDIFAAENRIAEGPRADAEPARSSKSAAKSPPTPAAPDTRRVPLRNALYRASEIETDRAARNQLRRMIDDHITEELRADPDHERRLFDKLMAIADDLGLRIDVTKLSDELLDMPKRRKDGDKPLYAPTFEPEIPPPYRKP